jgi:hypothetical protein
MVIAYWEIGKRVIEDEQQGNYRSAYGKDMLQELSKKLTADFGQGFSMTNLGNFRKFYQLFPYKPIPHVVRGESEEGYPIVENRTSDSKASKPSILHVLRGELSWTHYRLLIRIEDKDARNYYMNEAADQNWSTRTLERQIKTAII